MVKHEGSSSTTSRPKVSPGNSWSLPVRANTKSQLVMKSITRISRSNKALMPPVEVENDSSSLKGGTNVPEKSVGRWKECSCQYVRYVCTQWRHTFRSDCWNTKCHQRDFLEAPTSSEPCQLLITYNTSGPPSYRSTIRNLSKRRIKSTLQASCLSQVQNVVRLSESQQR
jgi:hypothetical protein